MNYARRLRDEIDSPSLDLGVRAGFHQCGLVLPEDDLRPDRVVIPCQEGRQLLEFGAGLLADRRPFELEEKICLQREIGRLRRDERACGRAGH